MKTMRVIPCVVLMIALLAVAPVPGATERVSPQRLATDGGVVLAGERQVPVEEDVEPVDAPAADAAEGDREAAQPRVRAVPPANQPPADVPPDVQQPPVEP